jgi:predicted ABC-type ATPase
MADAKRTARILVLAGPNGAGKSSVLGAFLAESQMIPFNPDIAAKLAREENPGLSEPEASIYGWHEGRRLLEEAMEDGLVFCFETTLGGTKISALLQKCLAHGGDVRIWYVGLASPEHCIQRVKARVAARGHDIPEERIRSRYDDGRLNLIRLLPTLTDLRVFDNTAEADPKQGTVPYPELILRVARGRVVSVCDLLTVPHWAKPIVKVAVDPAGSL